MSPHREIMDKPRGNCCQCMIKYTLFVFCYVFWVTSAVLIAVGIYAKVAKEGGVVDSLTADPALLLITIGSLMFIITFFGCFGALRNAVILLKLFLGILVAILLLQIAAAVLGFLFSDLVLDRTEQLMSKGIIRYREDMDLENLIDFVQKKFQCCGVDSHRDWSANVYFRCDEINPSLEGCGVPFSCCVRHKNETIPNTMCGYNVQNLEEASAAKIIYTIGCLGKMVLWGKRNLYLIAGMAVGLLGLEISMSCLAAAQMSHIRRKLQSDGNVY
ncbi:tetraspanin-33 isoform X1 [Conger conger]|uniref:tetraspanin-33 isoform X1 n=2 Tax=Conger conger TaxID=82655 RepID=UPI002A5A3D4D|nr:tetraspanin-33 isoform X1 [Conger conger]